MRCRRCPGVTRRELSGIQSQPFARHKAARGIVLVPSLPAPIARLPQNRRPLARSR